MTHIDSELELKIEQYSDPALVESSSGPALHSLKKCIRKESAICFTDYKMAGNFQKVFQTTNVPGSISESYDSPPEVISLHGEENPEMLNKCIKFWNQIIQENLEPIKCTMFKRTKKKDTKEEKKLTEENMKELLELRKVVGEMQKNQEKMRTIFKDAVAEIHKKNLHMIKLRTKAKCPQCKILDTGEIEDVCMDSKLNNIDELNVWEPVRKIPPPEVYNPPVGQAFQEFSRNVDDIIAKKEKAGEFKKWSRPQKRAICECNYLPDCICNTYNVVSKESVHVCMDLEEEEKHETEKISVSSSKPDIDEEATEPQPEPAALESEREIIVISPQEVTELVPIKEVTVETIKSESEVEVEESDLRIIQKDDTCSHHSIVIVVPTQEEIKEFESIRRGSSKPFLLIEEKCPCGIVGCDCIKTFTPILHPDVTDTDIPAPPTFHTVGISEATSSLELYSHLKQVPLEESKSELANDLEETIFDSPRTSQQLMASYLLPDGRRIFIEPQIFDNTEMPKLPEHLNIQGTLLTHKPSLELLKYKALVRKEKKQDDIDELLTTSSAAVADTQIFKANVISKAKPFNFKLTHKQKDTLKDKLPKSLSKPLLDKKLKLHDKPFPVHKGKESISTIETLGSYNNSQSILKPLKNSKTYQVYHAEVPERSLPKDPVIPRNPVVIAEEDGTKICCCGYNDCTCFKEPTKKDRKSDDKKKISKKKSEFGIKHLVQFQKIKTCTCGFSDCMCTMSAEKLKTELENMKVHQTTIQKEITFLPQLSATPTKTISCSGSADIEPIYPGQQICQTWSSRVITNDKSRIKDCLNKRKTHIKEKKLIENQISKKLPEIKSRSSKNNTLKKTCNSFVSLVEPKSLLSSNDSLNTGNFYSKFYKSNPEKYRLNVDDLQHKQFVKVDRLNTGSDTTVVTLTKGEVNEQRERKQNKLRSFKKTKKKKIGKHSVKSK